MCGKLVQGDDRWEYVSMDTNFGPPTGKSWPSVDAARIGLRDGYSLGDRAVKVAGQEPRVGGQEAPGGGDRGGPLA